MKKITLALICILNANLTTSHAFIKNIFGQILQTYDRMSNSEEWHVSLGVKAFNLDGTANYGDGLPNFTTYTFQGTRYTQEAVGGFTKYVGPGANNTSFTSGAPTPATTYDPSAPDAKKAYENLIGAHIGGELSVQIDLLDHFGIEASLGSGFMRHKRPYGLLYNHSDDPEDVLVPPRLMSYCFPVNVAAHINVAPYGAFNPYLNLGYGFMPMIAHNSYFRFKKQTNGSVNFGGGLEIFFRDNSSASIGFRTYKKIKNDIVFKAPSILQTKTNGTVGLPADTWNLRSSVKYDPIMFYLKYSIPL